MGQTADTVIAFYGLDRLRFVKPTFIGDTIHVTQKVEAKSERDDRSGIVTMLSEVINQRDEVVVSYTAKVLPPPPRLVYVRVYPARPILSGPVPAASRQQVARRLRRQRGPD